jgi:hypothetical protein
MVRPRGGEKVAPLRSVIEGEIGGCLLRSEWRFLGTWECASLCSVVKARHGGSRCAQNDTQAVAFLCGDGLSG